MNRVFQTATNRQQERELILLCLRPQPTADDHVQIDRLLENELNWSVLFQTVRRHGVLPLLCEKLKQGHWERVPAEVRRELEDGLRKNAIRNLGMTAELLEIVKLCREHSIPMISFKGIVLAQQLYSNCALRISNDLDLLIRPQDVSKMRELLAARSYEPSWNLREGYQDELLGSIRQLPLTGTRRPWIVELHTAMLHGPDARWTSYEAIDARRSSGANAHRLAWTDPQAQNIEICGQIVRTLAPDNALLYLCAHGAKHCWERLAWICDMAELIHRFTDLDWSAIRVRAREIHWERSLLLGLALARDLLGVVIPQEMESQHSRRDSLAETIARKLFAPPAEKYGTVWRLGFQIRCRDTWREQAWCAWSTIMQPTVADWQSVPVPKSLSVVHYLLRPLRLVGKYGSKSWRGGRR